MKTRREFLKILGRGAVILSLAGLAPVTLFSRVAKSKPIPDEPIVMDFSDSKRLIHYEHLITYKEITPHSHGLNGDEIQEAAKTSLDNYLKNSVMEGDIRWRPAGAKGGYMTFKRGKWVPHKTSKHT